MPHEPAAGKKDLVLFLDVDGVLNRTGFQPVRTEGLRSWIEPELAQRLCDVIRETNAALVLSSDWRLETEHAELCAELDAAGIDGRWLRGATADLDGEPRWREIEAWMIEHGVALDTVVIVDDFHAMGPLAARSVRTNPELGLDEDAARAIVGLFLRK